MTSDTRECWIGLAGIFKQSSHPLVLLCLFAFRAAAVATYLLCGFFTDNFVLSVSMGLNFSLEER